MPTKPKKQPKKGKIVFQKDKQGRIYVLRGKTKIYVPKKFLNAKSRDGLIESVTKLIEVVTKTRRRRRKPTTGKAKTRTPASYLQEAAAQVQARKSAEGLAKKASEDGPQSKPKRPALPPPQGPSNWDVMQNIANAYRAYQQRRANQEQKRPATPPPQPPTYIYATPIRQGNAFVQTIRSPARPALPAFASYSDDEGEVKPKPKSHRPTRESITKVVDAFKKKYLMPKGYDKYPTEIKQLILGVILDDKKSKEARKAELMRIGEGIQPRVQVEADDKTVRDTVGASSSSSSVSTRSARAKLSEKDPSAEAEEEIFEELEQKASGKKGVGLSETQINRLMSKYKSRGWIKTIAADEIKSVIRPKVHQNQKNPIAFVMNTAKRGQTGDHWVAVYINPKGKKPSIEYYNSFGVEPSEKTLAGLKAIMDKIHVSHLYKLKINRVKHQNNSSSNCGYFAMKFLLDTMKGKTFPEASGFTDRIQDKSKKYEKEIQKLKYQMKHEKFGYI